MSATTPTVRPDDDSILTPDVEPSTLESKPEDPNAGKLAKLLGEDADIRHVALVGLFILALFYTLHVAKAFILPIVLAILLDFLLSPLVRALRKIGIPEPVSAGVIVLGLVGVLVFGGYRLSGPAAEWVARAPQSIATVQQKLETLRRPVEKVTRAAAQVERATAVEKTPEVTVRGPTLSQQLFGGTAALIGAATVIVFLTYFLLAVGDLFLQKLVTVLPQFKDKKTAVKIARETESHISVYLFTTTLINIGVGVVTGVAMHLLGMPNPVLWGVVAGVLNFVPYVGAVVNTVILALAAFLAFEDTGRALLVPAVFTAINILEGNLITPMILGRRMRLNTVALSIGLVFWWYIWGVPGAILAVPILAALKITCDNIESLAPIGEFLGR
jgi:predicted PurR-regulated permease PerM